MRKRRLSRLGSIPITRSTSFNQVLTPFSTNKEGFPVDSHGGAGDLRRLYEDAVIGDL